MHKWYIYFFTALTFIILMEPLLSCRNNEFTTEDNAEIYAAVVRQLATVDDTFGGNLNPPILYIIRNTDDTAGNPSGQQTNTDFISQDIQDKITDALNDLQIEIVWIDKFQDAEFEQGIGSVKNNGAIITLGNIYPQRDATAWLAGSIYIGNLAAGGTTYVLSKINGVWIITGRTGPVWIS